MAKEPVRYRVKYWRWINDELGEWVITGLMNKKSAETIREFVDKYHENVTVYEDDNY